MAKNRSQDAKIKSTLIVLPLALMSQWKAEIECKSDLTVTTYHGPNRTKSVKELQAFDCVLTTYNILVSEGQDLLVSSPSLIPTWSADRK
jgi:SNF2 family DNA or RNA helicase